VGLGLRLGLCLGLRLRFGLGLGLRFGLGLGLRFGLGLRLGLCQAQNPLTLTSYELEHRILR